MEEDPDAERYKDLTQHLRKFIELSLQNDQKGWGEWVRSVSGPLQSRCWEKKECGERMCPAYMSECGRCWLIAGTMCGGAVQGKFAQKYVSCMSCDVYREMVCPDSITEMRELIVILTHSLKSKQEDLEAALQNVQKLSGLLPICAWCKKIRDDKGYWKDIEEFMASHPGVEFSHGVCPECASRVTREWSGGSEH